MSGRCRSGPSGSSFGKFHYKLTNALGTNDYLSGGGVRVGLGLNVGAQIALNPAMSLDLRAGYNLMSPLSTYGPSDFRTLGLSATMMFRVP